MPNLNRNLIQALPVFSAMDEPELDEVIAHAKARRIQREQLYSSKERRPISSSCCCTGGSKW